MPQSTHEGKRTTLGAVSPLKAGSHRFGNIHIWPEGCWEVYVSTLSSLYTGIAGFVLFVWVLHRFGEEDT